MPCVKCPQPMFLFAVISLYFSSAAAYFGDKNFECGPYGFVCEGKNRMRLCEGENLLGPTFLCPPDTICNEDSNDVCENSINYIEPSIRAIRCRRNERIADPNVPGCKGYILCIPDRNRFQGIKFKCSGNTRFNGQTRTCSSPEKYTCPIANVTKSIQEIYDVDHRRYNHRVSFGFGDSYSSFMKNRPIDCKNYKFAVTQEKSPNHATYFCPARPAVAGDAVRCTVFSNNFCIILERDDQDQFVENVGAAYRRPRKNLVKTNNR